MNQMYDDILYTFEFDNARWFLYPLKKLAIRTFKHKILGLSSVFWIVVIT